MGLGVALLGVHVCQFAQHSPSGVQAETSQVTDVCSVCAVAQSLLVAVFFLFLVLVPKSSRTSVISVAVPPFWRAERLWVRPPPAV